MKWQELQGMLKSMKMGHEDMTNTLNINYIMKRRIVFYGKERVKYTMDKRNAAEEEKNAPNGLAYMVFTEDEETERELDISAFESALKSVVHLLQEQSSELQNLYVLLGTEAAFQAMLRRDFPEGQSYSLVSERSTHVGKLEKKGKVVPSWRNRWFCLCGKYILYYRNKSASSPAGLLRLDGAIVKELTEEEAGRPLCFSITTPMRTLYCSANERSHMMRWVNAITEASRIVPREARSLLNLT